MAVSGVAAPTVAARREVGEPTTLGFSRGTRATFLAGLPLLGAALGFFLPRLAAAALRLPWVPTPSTSRRRAPPG
ncbi:YqeB family protein [Planosporangium mesophilum]|uniref:YqeB family protein n=1 Tax=Planosporangium mesophilum TaxID=689768 RepID=UPI003B84AA2B